MSARGVLLHARGAFGVSMVHFVFVFRYHEFEIRINPDTVSLRISWSCVVLQKLRACVHTALLTSWLDENMNQIIDLSQGKAARHVAQKCLSRHTAWPRPCRLIARQAQRPRADIGWRA